MGRIVYYTVVLFEIVDEGKPDDVLKDLKERAAQITELVKQKGFGVSQFTMEAGGLVGQQPQQRQEAGEEE